MKAFRRTGSKLQLTCHDCRGACAPKDGDWHEGVNNQVFLCRHCEVERKLPAKKSRFQPALNHYS